MEHVTLPDEDAAIEAELEATRREIEALRGDLGGEPEPEQQFAPPPVIGGGGAAGDLTSSGAGG